MVDILISVNVDDFFKNYLENDAEMNVGKFYDMRGEKNIVINEWQDPSETDKEYNGLSITKTRVMSLDV
jgi:hypothetical protein